MSLYLARQANIFQPQLIKEALQPEEVTLFEGESKEIAVPSVDDYCLILIRTNHLSVFLSYSFEASLKTSPIEIPPYFSLGVEVGKLSLNAICEKETSIAVQKIIYEKERVPSSHLDELLGV